MVEKAPEIDTPDTDAWKAEQKRQKAYDQNDQGEVSRMNHIAALLRERAGYDARAKAAQVAGEDGDKKRWEDRVRQVNASLKHYGYEESKVTDEEAEEIDRSTPPKGAKSAPGAQVTR